jgi:hypothetical protein
VTLATMFMMKIWLFFSCDTNLRCSTYKKCQKLQNLENVAIIIGFTMLTIIKVWLYFFCNRKFEMLDKKNVSKVIKS